MLKWTLLIVIVAGAAWPAGACAAATVKPRNVAALFVAPDTRAALAWQVESGKLDAPGEFTVRDYWEKPVATGPAKLTPDGGLEVQVKLAQGFHDVELSATGQRFGVVSLPACRGKADAFFCIDSALSWLVRDDDVRDGLIAALARSGVAMSRERLSWAQVNPADGKWDWQAPRGYEHVRKLHVKHGVEVLEMCHDSPTWPGRIDRYPKDLAAMARSWEQIGRRWHDTWNAIEVWNEPDIFFGGNLPADQYVPLVKALAYGLRRGGVPTPVIGGVVAHDNRRFLDTAGANGLLDCTEGFSFHTYGRAMQMEDLVGRYRAWLRDCGHEGMPLWLTECGRPWQRGPDRPPADQDADSALDITAKAVEARACGVGHYFAFVYPYYEENTNNFGMMGKRATPLRSFAAYAAAASILAHKAYLGDLACGDAAVRRARVFGDASETVAVLYTARADAKAKVKLDVKALEVRGIDGRAIAPADDGAVPVPDGLSYIRLDRAALGAKLRTDTPAMRLWRLGLAKARPAPPPAAIVLRFEADPKVLKPNSNGYRVPEDGAERLSLRVRAYNLADKPADLTLKLALPAEGKLVEGPAAQAVKVPPQGFADAAWRVDLAEAFVASGRARVTVTAEAAGTAAGADSAPAQPKILPLAIDLDGGATLNQILQRHGGRVRLPIQDLSRWTPNVPAHARMTMAWTPDKHWRLEVTFGKGDAWVYPYFALPEGLDLSKAQALAVRARCHKPAEVRVFLWEGGSVGYLTPASIIPADGQWHTAVVPFADLTLSAANAPDPNGRLDPKAVRRISIGLNSKAPTNTLDVSDVYVVGK